MRNKLTKTFNFIFLLTLMLFLLDALTALDIKSQALKSVVYYGLLISTPLILLYNFFFIEKRSAKLITCFIPFLALVVIIFTGPLNIIYSSGAWKTQKILYINGHLNYKKVEFQMQNIGALGYRQRTVQVLYLTDLFMISENPPDDVENRIEWIKTDWEKNEQGLK